MRTALAAILLLCPARGQSPVFWSPAPDEGRLELPDSLGGWAGNGPDRVTLRIRADADPRPRKDPGEEWWESYQRRRREREEAILQRVKLRMPGEAEADWTLLPLVAWQEEPAIPEPVPAARRREVAFLARYAQVRRQVEEELERAEAARSRILRVWFNGRPSDLRAELNEDRHIYLEPRAGENRLEVLDPATGRREVRTWWSGAAAAPRLQVRADGDADFKVLEPDGRLSRLSSQFLRANPAPGTYTVFWSGYEASGHTWWRPEEAAPLTVSVEVTLDAGTDRERRVRLGQLCLPGTGERVLGTFDVED